MTRDWSEVEIDRMTACRVCGSQGRTTRAHLSGRTYDEKVGPGRWKVHPDDVIALCGPVGDPQSCHSLSDAGRLDVLPYCSVEEQVRVVRHLRGIENARIRLAPAAYRRVAA